MKLELRSLRVINCGPLRDVLIDFCDSSGNPRPITVLGGANGSGKTTVLELIVALSAIHHPEHRNRPETEHYQNLLSKTDYAQMDWFIDKQPFSVISSPPLKGMDVPDIELPDNDYLISPDKSFTIVSEYVPSDSKMRLMPLIFQQELEEGNVIDFPASQKNELTVPSILFFPHHRFLTVARGQQIIREEIEYQWIYRYEAPNKFKGSLDSYLIWLDYAEPDIFTHVIQFLNGLDFDGKTFSIHRKELRAVVHTRDGQTHGVAELSSGEQNILIMLLELRRRLLPHSIVLIDEIENSLHPAYQYKLALALKKMQEEIPFQLIVTTHAYAFVEIFGLESTLILTEF